MKVDNVLKKQSKLRNYKLSLLELDKLYNEYEKNEKIPNPYKKASVYGYFVQSLINLGVNKSLTFREVKQEMKKLMQNDYSEKHFKSNWKAFEDKIGKDPRTALDVNGRIMVIAVCLNRVEGANPIGFKMKQLLSCVDILKGTDPLLKKLPNYRLNTTFNSISEVRSICE